MDIKFDYTNVDGSYRYEFVFRSQYPGKVDIYSCDPRTPGIAYRAWLHPIKDGKIIWRYDDFLNISQEAKDYINKIVKLRAFW